jgi:hypothetical protein
MTRRAWNAMASAGAAIITYGFARAVDTVVHSPRSEVLLVSDVVLATALSVGVYLWLNLRATRTRLTDLERAQIALDTQLSLAAEIQRHLLPPMPSGSDGVPPVDILNRTICDVPEPRTPDRVCDALMDMARRNLGPRGVANWQDDKTVLAFRLDGTGA